jgi:hypothetical protein
MDKQKTWTSPTAAGDVVSDVGSAIYSTRSNYSALQMSPAFIIEEQKQQLFGICEMIQSNMKLLLDKITKITHSMLQTEPETTKPLDLLLEYEVVA